MKRPVVYVASLAVLVVALLVHGYMADDAIEVPLHSFSSDSKNLSKPDDTTDLKQTSVLPSVKNEPVSAAPLVETNVEELENPFFEAETKARLIQVADHFAEDIQYPVYSKPIRSREELEKYLPNRSVDSGVQLDVKNPDSPRISLKTSKLQYFRGEEIVAEAVLEGALNPQFVEVQTRLVMDGQVLLEKEADAGSLKTRFHVNIDSNLIPSSIDSADLRLIASFSIDSRRYEIGTPLKYVNAIARIDYVGSSEVIDSVLQIPVYVTTSEPGFHQLSAILYNAETGEPVVQVNAEKELLVATDFIPLQAHIAALKVSGYEGPYLLKDFSLVRMPAEPDYTTKYGRVPSQGFQVNGYSFSDYLDEPFVDEDAQERLEFLRKLGGEV